MHLFCFVVDMSKKHDRHYRRLFEFQIIELVANLTTTEFIKSFKRLILRRGKPRVAYSDNAKTFRAGAKWLGNINKDQKLHDFLSRETIIWKFNVPKEL